MNRFLLGMWVALTLVGTPVVAQVVKESVPGVASFYRVESTVACASAITPEVIPQIKAMGYHSIINLREASERGVNLEESKAAAKRSGVAYFHIPGPQQNSWMNTGSGKRPSV